VYFDFSCTETKITLQLTAEQRPSFIFYKYFQAVANFLMRGHRAPTHSPLSLREAKTGKNNLNKEITTLLSTEMGERFSQTISNLGHAAPM
jgi:hypothetical protein